jgi:uncharacterized protein (TIGR03083 family)
VTDLPSAFTHEQCCTLVAEAVATFAEVAREVDPATPIPTCPGWTLSKLIRHTGTIHRWVAEIVATGSQERVDSRSLSLALPDDDRWLPGWLAGGGDALVEVLAAADPEAPVWAWGADQHVRFWPRRMIHETTVHRVDAERQPLQSAVDPLVAADGIDEFFTNVKPSGSFSPEVAELRGDGSLAFVAIDRALGAGARWRIDLADDGFTVARTDESGAEAADATVTGPPDRVLLLLYGRLELSTPGLSLTGDHALVDWWIEKSSLT